MVLVPSEPWVSIGILIVLVKDTRANESGGREKGGLGASTYWKHGQPTASTTAFFWSWLSLDALLKFTNTYKKIYLCLNFKSLSSLKLLFKHTIAQLYAAK